MKWILTGLLTLTLAGCSGGGIDERAHKVKTNPHVGPLPPECYSACTMEMASPYACILPGNWLGFHGPQNTRNEAEYWHYVDLIASHYPPKLAEWYRTEGHTLPFHIVSGQWVIDMGGRPCE
jgi:hypothetical protein